MLGRSLTILNALRDRRMRAHVLRAIDSQRALPAMTCPCCGYHGTFDSFGLRTRMAANCPGCNSKERHRLLAIATEDGFLDFAGTEVLHFAPEPALKTFIAQSGAKTLLTCDLTPGRADRVVDIEHIALPDGSFDRVICSHVLEHVDDTMALAEIARILRPGGYAILMVPIVEGWDHTLEDRGIRSRADREKYFGQHDHVRLYGSDFRQRIADHGLRLAEFTADGRRSPDHGLIRGEKIFKATK